MHVIFELDAFFQHSLAFMHAYGFLNASPFMILHTAATAPRIYLVFQGNLRVLVMTLSTCVEQAKKNDIRDDAIYFWVAPLGQNRRCYGYRPLPEHIWEDEITTASASWMTPKL